jgi:hypothetical protein
MPSKTARWQATIYFMNRADVDAVRTAARRSQVPFSTYVARAALEKAQRQNASVERAMARAESAA